MLVGLVLTACTPDPSPSTYVAVVKEARSGETIYRKHCMTCHQGALPDSPVLGNMEDWEKRLEKGREALIESVRNGIPPSMPLMGTCTSCTNEELGNAVDYMLTALEEDVVEDVEDEEAE